LRVKGADAGLGRVGEDDSLALAVLVGLHAGIHANGDRVGLGDVGFAAD
jgi:hypothetical protein